MRRILFSFLLALVFESDLEAQTPFYQGKTITLIVETTAGSTYDAYARFIAQRWGKHIPGNPDFIVQNMPGAGSLIAVEPSTGEELEKIAKAVMTQPPEVIERMKKLMGK